MTFHALLKSPTAHSPKNGDLLSNYRYNLRDCTIRNHLPNCTYVPSELRLISEFVHKHFIHYNIVIID